MCNQKNHLFFLVLIGITLLSFGCTFRKNPGDCVTSYLYYLNQENYEAAYNLISSQDKAFRSLKEFKDPLSGEFSAVWRFIDDNSTHKIIDTKAEEKTAIVTVTIREPDFFRIHEITRAEAFSNKSELDKYNLLKNGYFSQITFEERSAAFNLVEETDGWRIFFDWENIEKQREEDAERRRAEIEHYKQNIVIKNIEVEIYSDGDCFISGDVQNIGDRALTGVDVIVYGLDSTGNPLFEKKASVLQSFHDPLKPNYSKRFLVMWSRHDIPSDWSKSVQFSITDIGFSKDK